MTKASDNVFPKVIGAEGAAPATPAAGTSIIYVKADGLWYSKDDAGVETLVSGGAGGGSVATDAIWDAAGDLAVGSGANTAAKLAIGTAGQVLTVNAGATAPEWATAAGGGAAPFYYLDSTAAGADQSFSGGGVWADLFPTQMTASVPASANDILRIDFNCHTTDSGGQLIGFDFTVAGTRVGATSYGVHTFQATSGIAYGHQYQWLHKVAAGDISGGNVAIKVQIRAHVNGTPDVKYTSPPAVLVVTNLGTSS